jgi:hypothetical protein
MERRKNKTLERKVAKIFALAKARGRGGANLTTATSIIFFSYFLFFDKNKRRIGNLTSCKHFLYLFRTGLYIGNKAEIFLLKILSLKI